MDPDIDHDGAWCDIAGVNKLRLASRDHQDVSFSAYVSEILRARVAYRHGGVLGQQQQRWACDHSGAADHHGSPAAQRHVLVLENLHHGGGRRCREGVRQPAASMPSDAGLAPSTSFPTAIAEPTAASAIPRSGAWQMTACTAGSSDNAPSLLMISAESAAGGSW